MHAPTHPAAPYPHQEARRREHLPAWAVIGLPVWVVYAVGLFVVRHRFAAGMVAIGAAAWWLIGPIGAGVIAGSLVLVLAVWRVSDRDTFDAATAGAASQWRAMFYRRRWARTMRSLYLDDGCPITRWTPTLLRVSSIDAGVDRLHVRPLAGQTSAEFRDRADLLALILDVQAVRVSVGRAGTVWLDVHRGAVRPAETLTDRAGTDTPAGASQAVTAAHAAALAPGAGRAAITQGVMRDVDA